MSGIKRYVMKSLLCGSGRPGCFGPPGLVEDERGDLVWLGDHESELTSRDATIARMAEVGRLLIEIASAADRLCDGAEEVSGEVDLHDLDRLGVALAALDSLPELPAPEVGNGPAKAERALLSDSAAALARLRQRDEHRDGVLARLSIAAEDLSEILESDQDASPDTQVKRRALDQVLGQLGPEVEPALAWLRSRERAAVREALKGLRKTISDEHYERQRDNDARTLTAGFCLGVIDEKLTALAEPEEG